MASTIFSGNSRYATDFKSIIDRSVAIASLPMLQMQNVSNALRSRSDALSGLDKKVTAVQTALTSIGSALGMKSYATSVSDSTILSASVSAGVREGVYNIEVTKLGSSTNTLSKAPGALLSQVTNPDAEGLGVSGPFKLYLNTTDDAQAITVTPSGSTLNDLVDAINSSSSDVHATLVNMGGSGGPDYRLTIQHAKFGANTIQLKDSSGNAILDTLSAGTAVTYKINGSTEISNDTRNITLAPGLKITLEGQSAAGVSTKLEVSRNADGVRSALTSFVQAYNAVVDEIDTHRGSGTGVLKGDSILATVTETLRSLTGYSSGSSGIDSLTDLGLEFSNKGKLSLSTSVFDGATAEKFSQLAAFLGSDSEGGFLMAAAGAMDLLEADTNGLLKSSITSTEAQIASQTAQIDEQQERIDRLTESLQRQMAASDALIAALEQQANYFNSMFESMRIANLTYN
jgi:flagellar hook-associated protein 2